MHINLQGFYRLKVTDCNGHLKQDTGWFENLIVNQGLDWLGVPPSTVPSTNYDTTLFCQVGTGNTTPAFTDTVLTAPTVPYAIRTGTTRTYTAGPPTYWSQITTYQWPQGAVTGNFTEIGIGCPSSTASPYTGIMYLFSHALIVDSSGNPTTLSVTSTDTLSASYEVRLYPNITDTNYSLTIGGTVYSGIYRFCNITSPSTFFLITIKGGGIAQNLPYLFYYNGTIGNINSAPSGASFSVTPSGGVVTISNYTLGSYTVQMTLNAPANYGTALNITAIEINTTIGHWQFSVSPSWNRALVQNISTTWQLSWGRY